MMEDGNGNYYDPNDYITSNDAVVAMQLGVSGSNRYRRIYRNLQYENIQDSSTKFMATDITAVPDSSAAYAPFFNNTRLQMAKQAIDAAVSENAGSSFRWGLIKLRQTNPSWRISPNCDKPVRITGNASLAMVSDANPCNVGGAGKYGIYAPNPGGAANYTIEALNGGNARMVAPANNTATSVLTIVRRPIGDNLGLVPAGAGASTYNDRPLSHALDDARSAAMTAMTSDNVACRTCRNTVVVLITSGRDDGDAVY